MLTRADGARDFWVFGYGSLMWKPGFDFVEKRAALIEGYRRSLCIYSHFHRGTRETPGLVLGLDAGLRCQGVAFRVAPEASDSTLAYLREREMQNRVYHEVLAPVALDDGRHVEALAFVCNTAHPQYAAQLDREAVLRHVRQGFGVSGANVDYVCSTVDQLVAMGVDDPELAWIAAELRALPADGQD